MSLMRVLLDPAAVEGGAANPAPEPTPKPQPRILVDAAEYTNTFQRLSQLESKLATIEAEKTAALEAARAKHIEEMAKTQGATAALEEQRRQLQEERDREKERANALDRDWLSEKKDNVIASAVANRKFVSDSAREQAIALLRARFDVRRENDQVVVRDKLTGRFASESVPELMGSQEYAHFLEASSRGGSGAGGGNNPVPQPKAQPQTTDLMDSNTLLKATAARFAQGGGLSQGTGLRPVPRSA